MKKLFLGLFVIAAIFAAMIGMARNGFPLLSFLHSLHHFGENEAVAPKPTARLILEGSVVATDEPAEAEFRNYLREVSRELPRAEAIRNDGRDLSHAPVELRDVAVQFGKISGELNANPEHVPAAVNFFDECVRREETLQAVRAVCLWHLRRLTLRMNRPGLIDESSLPEPVRRVADQLPR